MMKSITQFALITLVASAAILKPADTVKSNAPLPKILDCGNSAYCNTDGIFKEFATTNLASRHLNNEESFNFAQTAEEAVYEPTDD